MSAYKRFREWLSNAMRGLEGIDLTPAERLEERVNAIERRLKDLERR